MKIAVKVKPNAKQQKITMVEDGSLVIALKSSPIEGKANQELIKLLAEYYQIAAKDVVIKSGRSSRNKLVEIPDHS